ncbi:RES domain-containing protein [Streptomyces atratus]|uniref:RES domain-containing protein n=1 Tax=Streptomyces atratus TaxID=1893 RepID=UPI002255D339|nr:RES domain-containing protein [Streptomyces atratus]MCX5340334.1 RES domain-containing protein [Streptomyces atratus]
MNEKQYLCLDEIHDAALRRELAGYCDPGRCDFCGSTPGEGVVAFGDFLEEIMSAVRWAYERASDAAVLFEDGDWLAPTMTLPDIIREILGESDAVTAAVASVAEEHDDGDTWVRRDYPWPTAELALHRGWDDFCAAVDACGPPALEPGSTGQSLEFRKYAPREMLDLIYDVADKTGRIVPLGADTTLWRSRVSVEPIECTAAALGPAPPDRAAANRMSGAGVSMFYGAEDPLTAQREVLAHHDGSSPVSVATCRFSLLRDVWILDLVDLEPVPSIFDRHERELRPFYDFMHHFAEQVRRPLDPDDVEASGYAYTQIFTQYLRHDTSLVSGIRFQSVQSQGVNCVVFAGPERCTDPPAQPQDHLLVLEPGTFTRGPAAMPT